MLLDVTITPLTSLPTAHPSAEAVRRATTVHRPVQPVAARPTTRFTKVRPARLSLR